MYLIKDHTDCYAIATHEQLHLHNEITVGDSVVWNTGNFTVTSTSPNSSTVTLKGVHQIVKTAQLTLIKRATAMELDNAIRKIYGPGSNLMESEDDIKMGYVEMTYGQLVYDEIIRARIENTKHKR